MIRSTCALKALIDGIRGAPVVNAKWDSVIALANHTLLTPTLFSSLVRSGQIDSVPQEVGDYLRFMHGCNQDRNLRLRAQLYEAVAALNAHDIVPLLLKGAVPVFLSPGDRLPSRMTSDLDICVEAAEKAAAEAYMQELGYVQVLGMRGMARPEDVGALELRSSQTSGYEPPELVERNGLRVKIPPIQSRALNWLMHDLLKEGDYWRGRIDLRHLHDLAQLAEGEGLDWKALRASMPNQSARNAFDTQLLALHRLFGIAVPVEWVQRPLIRFQNWRRVFTASHPVTSAPLRLAGNLVWGVRRLSLTGDLVRSGPTNFARRVATTILDRDLRSKI
jgi:hypothetical protein